MSRCIDDMPIEEYHAHPAISNSGLKLVGEKSVNHFLHRQKEPVDRKALRKGQAVHTFMLEGQDKFEREFKWPKTSREDDRRTREGKAWLAENENGDAVILRRNEVEEVHAMCTALAGHPMANRILRQMEGQREVSFFAEDRVFGCETRCRADLLMDRMELVDLKTTRDASPEAFARSIARYGYDHQWAFYDRVIEAVTGERTTAFIIVCVENEAPHEVAIYQLEQDWLDRGAELVHRNLTIWADYLATPDQWTGYHPRIQPLEMPHYMRLEA